MKAMKLRKNKKGFTLVEVIVVLVILAILAAILIPTLTGYIDKANEKAVMAEARSAVMAANTLVAEKYAGGSVTVDEANIAELAELASSDITSLSVGSGYIKSLTYDNGTYHVQYTRSASDEPGTFGTPTKD